MVPSISLKNDVQTMAYPEGGAIPFILLSPSERLRVDKLRPDHVGEPDLIIAAIEGHTC